MRKLLVATGVLLLCAGPAVAQTSTTDYPPSTSSTSTSAPTTTSGPTTTIGPGTTTSTTAGPRIITIDEGKLEEGQRKILESCGFGQDPTVFFNSSLVDNADEIDANGCARQAVTIIEDGEPDNTALGRPALAAIGAPVHLAQARPTPIVDIDGQRFAARGNGRENVLQNVGFGRDGRELIVRHLFTIGEPDGGRGALARTGATIVRWGLPGAALLGVGALLVLAARRRRALV